jgi:putative phosphoribosyl transferase
MTTQGMSGFREKLVRVPPLWLEGLFSAPRGSRGAVVFAHGSGSSRMSSRNRMVAAALNDAGLATLLFDLLTDAEADDRANVFDIPLLAQRVEAGVDFVRSRPETKDLPVGLFGASTGAAAALVAAALRPSDIAAVVSRGGRPDLAGERLPLVEAPTLLIVGGEDRQVLSLNEAARKKLGGPSALEVIPGATHLFEEAGAMEEVAHLATAWFLKHAAEARHDA